MQNKRYKFLLFFLILVLISLNYNKLDGFLIKTFDAKETVIVERVIDGDTVVVNGTSVRLLGINTPEKKEKYYSEAKSFMEKNVMNKTLFIERKGKDLYNRDLAYLFDGNENINLKMIESGYANYYFPSGKDNYYTEFFNAWENCEINLCEKSNDKCASCIILKKFGYDENVLIYNQCNFDCDLTEWSVKDEGRKKFIFGNFTLKKYSEKEITNEDFGEEYVWTKTGDTIFLRDKGGKLVLWENY